MLLRVGIEVEPLQISFLTLGKTSIPRLVKDGAGSTSLQSEQEMERCMTKGKIHSGCIYDVYRLLQYAQECNPSSSLFHLVTLLCW